MDKKKRAILLDDLDKILNLSFNYCRFSENAKVRDAAREINNKAYETIKYINRHIKKKKRKKKQK